MKGKSSPCVYLYPQRNIQVYVHGDGFVVVGDRSQVEWFRKQLASVYEIKSQMMSGTYGDSEQVRFLMRLLPGPRIQLVMRRIPGMRRLL